MQARGARGCKWRRRRRRAECVYVCGAEGLARGEASRYRYRPTTARTTHVTEMRRSSMFTKRGGEGGAFSLNVCGGTLYVGPGDRTIAGTCVCGDTTARLPDDGTGNGCAFGRGAGGEREGGVGSALHPLEARPPVP